VRQLPKARPVGIALATLLLLLVGGSCATAPTPTQRPPSVFVIPTDLPNGRAEITIAPSYPIGATLTVPIAIVVTRGTVTGPVAARIMASGINEGGSPAEVLVRELVVAPVIVAGGRGSTTVTWDTRDLKGVLVPADAYSLVLELRSDDAATTKTVRAGATLELR